MSNTLYQEKDQSTAEKKTRRGTVLIVLLSVFIILLVLTTAVLGSHLYEMATRDQYTVNLEVGSPEGSIELFRIEYANEQGEITVQGVNADNVVAPGTKVGYDIRLKNNDDVVIDFVMMPTVEFLTDDAVPVEFKVMDDNGNYILGDEEHWVSPEEMSSLYHKGSVHPGEVFTYHVIWQWVFEVDDDQDSYDTLLGNQNGTVLPGVRVGITTDAVANPMPVKSNTHMMHLVGEGFGCCWCCWLVWLLILVIVVLLVWLVMLRRKISKLEALTDQYAEALEQNGLLEVN